ncbi:MAG: 4'-phosphopantetheinyl transferase superfamily protein [Pseudomonadota bacterium]
MNPVSAHLWLHSERPEPGDAALLDADERARAARFVRAEDRARFVAAHALLRRALSHGREVPPEAWRFRQDEAGKPWVEGGGPAFSLSHWPGGVAALVADAGPIGVDGERLGRLSDPLALTRGIFSPEERAVLADPATRERRFLERWCLKEAWSKAVGGGLALPVERVAFEVGTGGAVGLSLPDDLGRAADWTLRLLAPAPAHLVAVALGGGHPWRLLVHPSAEILP